MDIKKTKTNPPQEKLLRLWKLVKDIVADPNAEDSKLRPTGYHDSTKFFLIKAIADVQFI